MRYLSCVAAVVGMLVCTNAVQAISFAPPRSVSLAPVTEAPEQKPIGLTVGLSASSWDQADTPVTGLGTFEFSSKLRPLVTAEYRVNDRFSVGGWYNFISWDLDFKPVPTLVGLVTATATAEGGIFELHGTYDFPMANDNLGVSAQVGIQRTAYDINGRITAAGLPAPRLIEDEAKITQAIAWGLGTYRIPAQQGNIGFGLMGGLGLAQGLDKDSGSTELHGMLGVSVAFTPMVSVDASLWFPDFTRKTGRTRFTAGVTGRF